MGTINELSDVENQIKHALDKVCYEWYNKGLYGDGNWTRRIKELLGELGKDLGYMICASGGNYDCGEWLYDLVWYRENDEGNLISIPLVVESEWGKSLQHIKYDFEKLLLANSNLRLMICQATGSMTEDVKKYFKQAVQVYKTLPSGSRFLIAIFHGTGNFLYEVIIKE